jgi:hypothetical protein
VLGVRACDLAALVLQDKHFLHQQDDPGYRTRRTDLLLVAVDCGFPADTCFCASRRYSPGDWCAWIPTGRSLASAIAS